MKIIVLKCPNCGQNIEGGTELAQVKFCTNCGSELKIENYIRIENRYGTQNVERKFKEIEVNKQAKKEYKRDARHWYILTVILYLAASALLFLTCEPGYLDDETVPKILAYLASGLLVIFPIALTIKRPVPPKDAEMIFKVNRAATFFFLLLTSALIILTSIALGNEEIRSTVFGL